MASTPGRCQFVVDRRKPSLGTQPGQGGCLVWREEKTSGSPPDRGPQGSKELKVKGSPNQGGGRPGGAGQVCAEPRPRQPPASFPHSVSRGPSGRGSTPVSLVWRMLLRLVAAAQWRAGPGTGAPDISAQSAHLAMGSAATASPRAPVGAASPTGPSGGSWLH